MFSKLYFFNFRVFLIIIYQNLRHFSWRRFLFTILMVLIFAVIIVLTILLRLLDEVFYRNYRKINIKEPVFIISTPRSGTTLLHRLIATDDCFTYFLLYHNFIPSVIFYKFILFLKRIDNKLGGSMKRFWNKVEDRIFSGWKGIHNLGFEKSEEDEGLFALTMNSPACGIFCPYTNAFTDHIVNDRSTYQKKKNLTGYYYNTLQRFMYAWGDGKRLLVKNVMSCSRVQMILEKIPDAKIIIILRHPYETIPSITSMFSKSWSVIAPEIPQNDPAYRYWGALNIDFYKQILSLSRTNASGQIMMIRYSDLVNDAHATINNIYKHFGFEQTAHFQQQLIEALNVSGKYAKGHSYTLEQYGYSKELIDRELSEVLDAFGFEKNKSA